MVVKVVKAHKVLKVRKVLQVLLETLDRLEVRVREVQQVHLELLVILEIPDRKGLGDRSVPPVREVHKVKKVSLDHLEVQFLVLKVPLGCQALLDRQVNLD